MNEGVSRQKATMLVCEIAPAETADLLAALAGLGVTRAESQQGRMVQLHESRPPRWLPLPPRTRLLGSPVEIVRCIVPAGRAASVASGLLAGGLGREESGAALRIEEFDAIRAETGAAGDATPGEPDSALPGAIPAGMMSRLTNVVVVVARGEGDNVATVALEHGLCVPVLTFGLGSGLRDRLGLLRVTIPPEKEVAMLTIPEADAEVVVAMLAAALRIDRPGQGFVYALPVHSAMHSRPMRIGHQTHAATMEQIIDAVDRLHGGTGWRRRRDQSRAAGSPAAHYLRTNDILEMVVDEESGSEFLDVAMEAGANGATTCRTSAVATSGDNDAPLPLSRSSLVLPQERVAAVVAALAEAGFFASGGHLEHAHCPFVLGSRN